MWFIRRAIKNNIALNNLTGKYQVTYNINDHIFTVNRDKAGLPNMEFLMHESGMNYYKPPKNGLLFLNTVSKNKKCFRKRLIKDAIKARELQNTLGFTTVKKLKWIIRINQIQEFTV